MTRLPLSHDDLGMATWKARGLSSISKSPFKIASLRSVTNTLRGSSGYGEVRATADGRTLLALQSQNVATIQVTTPGNVSEARPLSNGNQSGGGPVSQFTDYNAAYPTVSPDGKWVACFCSPDKNQSASLAMVSFAGGQPAKVFARSLSSNGVTPLLSSTASMAWTTSGNNR
jgi:hypothetical protein